MNDFDYQNSMLKKIGNNARRKKSTHSRKGCKLPSDSLTKAQINKLERDVQTVNLYRQLDYTEFKKLKTSLQAEYLKHIWEHYQLSLKDLASFMNTTYKALYQYIHKKSELHEVYRIHACAISNPQDYHRLITDYTESNITTTEVDQSQAREPSTRCSETTTKIHDYSITLVEQQSWDSVFEILKGMPIDSNRKIKIFVE